MQKTVRMAIADLATARLEFAAAIRKVDDAEQGHGPDSDRAMEVTERHELPASLKITAAEKALVETTAKTPLDALRKIRMLLVDNVLEDHVASVQNELDSLLTPQEDPIVPLCERWLTITKYLRSEPLLEQMEFDDAFSARSSIEDQILALTPQSAKGVALLSSVIWYDEGPTRAPGTEGWEAEVNTPGYRMLSRLRSGAHRVAEQMA